MKLPEAAGERPLGAHVTAVLRTLASAPFIDALYPRGAFTVADVRVGYALYTLALVDAFPITSADDATLLCALLVAYPEARKALLIAYGEAGIVGALTHAALLLEPPPCPLEPDFIYDEPVEVLFMLEANYRVGCRKVSTDAARQVIAVDLLTFGPVFSYMVAPDWGVRLVSQFPEGLEL